MYGCVDLEMRDRRVVDMGFRGLDALSFLLCTSSMRFWLCFLLFSHHRYSPSEKLLSVFVFISGLSLRWISERLSITHASRKSVRIWKDSFSKLYSPSKSVRRLVAVDDTVVKVNGYRYYLWAAKEMWKGE